MHIAVRKQKYLIRDIQKRFIVVVGNDDASRPLLAVDNLLDRFYGYGAKIGERLIEYAERRPGAQHQPDLKYPLLAPGELTDLILVLYLELREILHKALVVRHEILKDFAELHTRRQKRLLREILDMQSHGR